jgi:ABC transporter substrate binding protein (PQQ-dependent alcohol dehydrogenase system)
MNTERSYMQSTGRVSFWILVLAVLCIFHESAACAAQLREVRIGYFDLLEDPFYTGHKGYAGLYTVEHISPVTAAELATDNAIVTGEAIGVKFVLLRRSVTTGEDIAEAFGSFAREQQLAAAIVDLPLQQTIEIAVAAASISIPLFNARHTDIALREATCRTNLFHTIPSLDMLTDGLAQGLLSRNWKRVLLLEGENSDDTALSKAFQASAKKFGLDVVDVRRFVLGNDPRQRDQNNVRLLTAGVRHDVVFVADALRQFAPFVPYNTMDPRPVIGSEGLVPLAWHIYWERHGAPQLNRRFAKRSGRLMTDADWATWVAVRSVVEATVRNRNSTMRPLTEALLDPDLTLELYKGFPGSFRLWNRQFRQAILLATPNSVVGLAPVEGALHKDNNLDTLGLDAPEFHCEN